MGLKNKLLKVLTRRVIRRNEKFNDIHAGESCYIFGNGASLKYYDLTKFNDKPSIGCGSLFLHKDFKKMDVKYYYEGHPFFYYPYWINPYSKIIEKNIYGSFHKKNILLNNNISFFLSVSNFFGIKGRNIYCVHHFGEQFDGFDNCSLDGNFTSMASGLSGMIGLAIFLGFKDITLVGCDYTFYPQVSGHFYEINKAIETFHDTPANEEILRAASDRVDLRVVVPSENYKGHILPSISYEKLTGAKPVYSENHLLLLKEDLLALNDVGMNYNIFS